MSVFKFSNYDLRSNSDVASNGYSGGSSSKKEDTSKDESKKDYREVNISTFNGVSASEVVSNLLREALELNQMEILDVEDERHNDILKDVRIVSKEDILNDPIGSSNFANGGDILFIDGEVGTESYAEKLFTHRFKADSVSEVHFTKESFIERLIDGKGFLKEVVSTENDHVDAIFKTEEGEKGLLKPDVLEHIEHGRSSSKYPEPGDEILYDNDEVIIYRKEKNKDRSLTAPVLHDYCIYYKPELVSY